MAGHRGRLGTAFGSPGVVAGDGRREHQRLRVGGEFKRFLGAQPNQVGHVFTQCRRGFGQGLLDGGVVTPRVEHAHRLGTLAGKDKSECGHQ